MKKTLIALLLGGLSLTAAAQDKVYQIDEITAINYGDGRLLFRQNNNDKTPLNGSHRLIDGYHSEYILAEFKDGMYHGSYKHFKNNLLKEEATYNNGNLDGVRKRYYADGKTLQNETHFTEGKLNGVNKSFFQNGKVETEKGYKMGVEDGPERRYDNDGTLRSDLLYKDGKPEGTWVEHLMSNVGDFTRTSRYKDGLRNGEWSDVWKDGTPRSKTSYKDGKKDGISISYRKDGKPEQSTTYKNDERHGEEIVYFTNGEKEKSVCYANDKRDGLSRDFYQNGKTKSEYLYKAGKREGAFKRFYEDGIIREEGRYENDTEVYRKEYYASGKLKAVAERKDGSWTTTERYDADGKKL